MIADSHQTVRDGWHVAICNWSRIVAGTKAIAALECVTEVCSPAQVTKGLYRGRVVERSNPWLGPMVLARWPGDDPHAWHDIKNLSGVIGILGGWPPATISDGAVERFLDTVRAIDNGHVEIRPPCAAGDIVRFSHLEIFHRVVGRCVWVADGGVGVRVPMLGREMIITVPYTAIESVDPRRVNRHHSLRCPQFGRRRR